MSFSLLRRVGFSRSAGIFLYVTEILRCPISYCGSKLGGHRLMSTIGSDESPPSRMSPSLILPPAFEGDDMAYKFYNLTEERVWTIEKRIGKQSKSPDDDAELVGSSHGWLALFNRRNNDLFLSNPFTRRHIELPWIGLLPDDELNMRGGHGSVSKVILSSSPDEQGCRAAIIYGPGNRLAFCTPGRSECEWSPIGNRFQDYEIYDPRHLCARVYEDLVCCSRRKVLTCMTPCELDLLYFHDREGNFPCEIEDWDIIGENYRGARYMSHVTVTGENTRCWVEENNGLLEDQCVQIPHLVYAEERLYLVMRFVALQAPDGTYVDPLPHSPTTGLRGYFPCQTVGFVVVKVNDDGIREVVDDLDGLALFVGVNHSFAISADEFKLMPNSIYFTDAKRLSRLDGRDDIGIFDYKKKTISHIFIQGNKRIESSLGWFTPN